MVYAHVYIHTYSCAVYDVCISLHFNSLVFMEFVLKLALLLLISLLLLLNLLALTLHPALFFVDKCTINSNFAK